MWTQGKEQQTVKGTEFWVLSVTSDVNVRPMEVQEGREGRAEAI